MLSLAQLLRTSAFVRAAKLLEPVGTGSTALLGLLVVHPTGVFAMQELEIREKVNSSVPDSMVKAGLLVLAK